jgi:hypothetical protein
MAPSILPRLSSLGKCDDIDPFKPLAPFARQRV